MGYLSAGSSGGQDYKHQAVSSLQNNKAPLMFFNAEFATLLFSNNREANCTNHFCSIKVQQEKAVQKKKKKKLKGEWYGQIKKPNQKIFLPSTGFRAWFWIIIYAKLSWYGF